MDTEILNRALIKIGESPVSSRNQSPLGEVLKIVYEEVRQLLLASYPWRFALKRVLLSPLNEESDNPRFKYKFQIPSDCLLFRSVSDIYKSADLRNYRATSGTIFEIEGRTIYSNHKKLSIKYIADVPETLYSVNFKEAFANKIAAELSIKVHQNLNLVQLYEQKFQQALENAIRHNEIISDTEQLPDNTWITIREGWTGE